MDHKTFILITNLIALTIPWSTLQLLNTAKQYTKMSHGLAVSLMLSCYYYLMRISSCTVTNIRWICQHDAWKLSKKLKGTEIIETWVILILSSIKDSFVAQILQYAFHIKSFVIVVMATFKCCFTFSSLVSKSYSRLPKCESCKHDYILEKWVGILCHIASLSSRTCVSFHLCFRF